MLRQPLSPLLPQLLPQLHLRQLLTHQYQATAIGGCSKGSGRLHRHQELCLLRLALIFCGPRQVLRPHPLRIASKGSRGGALADPTPPTPPLHPLLLSPKRSLSLSCLQKSSSSKKRQWGLQSGVMQLLVRSQVNTIASLVLSEAACWFFNLQSGLLPCKSSGNSSLGHPQNHQSRLLPPQGRIQFRISCLSLLVLPGFLKAGKSSDQLVVKSLHRVICTWALDIRNFSQPVISLFF